MAGRGEISRKTLDKFLQGNPDTPPTFGQYVHAVAAMHSRGAHDEGGKVIHATPPALRSEYARRIARTKSRRRSEVPF